MRLYAVVAFAVAAVAVGALGFLVEVPSPTPYSPFNTGPSGYSALASYLGAEPLTSVGGFNGSLIVPFTHYLSDDELRALAGFVAGGGRLVIVDEGGYSNALLTDYLNLSLVVVPVPVYDYVLNYGGNASIALINASVGDVAISCYFGLTASASLSGSSVGVLANSSSLSFRDIDGNGFFSPGDQFGPFPVVAGGGVGGGSVYVVTDLDAFSNGLIDLGNNSALARYLVGGGPIGIYLGGLNTSLIDYVKLYARAAGGWVGDAAELGSLLVIAVVVIYGRRYGVLE